LNTQSKPPNLTFRTNDKHRIWLPEGPVRTRFAPSPTGNLHLGSIRTALYNYLIAKRTGGQFILRIEDTDDKRTVADATKQICRDLRWAGLQWDEGPVVGGPYGPYVQSERVGLYRAAANELLENGHAYRCFCDEATLKSKAKLRLKAGQSTEYDRTCYHIPKEQSDDWAAQGRAYIVRLKASGEVMKGRDLTYGHIFDYRKQKLDGMYKDRVLLKSNGLPTYHLASVVDDHHMRITHVIRGVEWLISTQTHIALYEAFGWKPPTFAHVGLLLDENNNKLSKREKRFDLRAMQNEGVLPEALCNYLALMGWKHVDLGDNSDFLPMEKLKEIFDLRFTKSNPKVSLNKLWHLQRLHMVARVEAGGTKFEELVRLVMDTVEWQFGHSELSLVGISNSNQLKNRCEWLLKANGKNFTTVTDFVKQQAYLFSSRPYISKNGLLVEKAILPTTPFLRNMMEEYGITDEDIRKKLLEVLFPKNGSDGFAGTVEELKASVESVIDYIVCIFKDPNKTWVARRLDEKKCASTLVYSRLRSWIAWGLSGPSLVEAMYQLGPKIVRNRIEKVEILYSSPDVAAKEVKQRQEAVPADASAKREVVN
jgi:glutamyl-tRNA synthetase